MSNSAFGKVHVPYGADGSGTYTIATLGCFNVIQEAAPIVLNALGKIELPAGTALRVVDYGTADGGTSMPLMHEIIKAVRDKDGRKQIEITYEDQPNNDFKSLFFYTQGISPLPIPCKSLKEYSGVFVTASGTGFFNQCVPNETAHLGVCFTAMHWLSRKPCNIKNYIHMTGHLDGRVTAEEKAAFAAQAAADFEQILLSRAAELVPGGQLVIVNFAVSDANHWLGHTDVGACMYTTMDKHWRAMRDEGRITPAEYEDTTFINYYRDEAEMCAPFKEGSAVHRAGLRLVSHSFKTVRCPFRAKWLAEKGDAAAHAKWFVPTTRTWSNSTFRSALADSRSDAEKDALVDEMFSRYERDVASAPENFHMDYVHSYLAIEKAV